MAELEPHERELLLSRSDKSGLAHLVGHLSILGLTGAWIWTAAPLWQIAVVVHGIALIFLFTLLHECTHMTPFKSRWLNVAAGTLCGVLLLLPYRWFTYFHLAHHRFTHDPDHDPELALPKPQNRWQHIVYVSGVTTWWSQLKVLILNATVGQIDDFVPRPRRSTVRAEARAHLVVYGLLAAAGIATGSTALIWMWIVPALLGQPFLRLHLLAEHTLCPHVPDMLDNTRTTFTTIFVRFMTWNMPFHTEHHCCPEVPFHRLPALHRLIKQHLRNTESGYTAFHRRFARQLKPAARTD